MEVISPPHGHRRPSIAPLILGTIIATVLVVGGVVLGWVALATPMLSALLPGGRPDVAQTVTGMVVWAVALVAPAAFVLIGATRLARNLASVKRHVPRRSPVMRAMSDLPADSILASGITLPDGRGVGELVVGAFGAAVIRELPPAAVTRIREGHWEVRGSRGWIPLESPLERAVRDAERVRHWLASDDADFIVKTYAAVVGPAPTVARTTACAVLTPDQIAPWIAGLPPQRTLTPGRRELLAELVREAAN